MNYEELEKKIHQWGLDRGIIQNGTALTQAIKTSEEVSELLAAINHKDLPATKDAVGDIIVTLIMCCAISDITLVDCLAGAYDEIKDRKGYLRADGMFIKEVE